jgi:hypothetical protein
MSSYFDSIWKLDDPMFLEESRCRRDIHAGTEESSGEQIRKHLTLGSVRSRPCSSREQDVMDAKPTRLVAQSQKMVDGRYLLTRKIPPLLRHDLLVM